jgi:hypothetical protein
MYNVPFQAPQSIWPSYSLRPCDAALLVVLGRLHVLLLDVLPLSLPSALAIATCNAVQFTYALVETVPDLL